MSRDMLRHYDRDYSQTKSGQDSVQLQQEVFIEAQD
jgi:hypothetical protein